MHHSSHDHEVTRRAGRRLWPLLALLTAGTAAEARGGVPVPPPVQEVMGQERPDLGSPRRNPFAQTEGERHREEPEAESPRRQKEKVTLSPSTVTVLEGKVLRSTGVRFASDALRLLPGLEVTRANSTDSNVSVRGFGGVSSSAQGILTLVDGFQVYNDFFGNTLWDGLPVPMSEVDRIEVIRGPGSFLHGPNAMHGLVDFRTGSPLDQEFDPGRISPDYVSLDLGLGSYGSRTATLVDVHRTERTSLKTTLSWDDINRFDDRDANAKDKRYLELRLEHGPEADRRLELTGGLLEYDMDLFLPQVLVVAPAELATDIRETYLRGRWKHEGLTLATSWRNFQSTSIADQFYPDFDVVMDTVDLDLQYAWPALGPHELVMGTGARRSTFRTRNQDVALGGHATDLGWVFLEDRLALGEDWFLTAGLRLDQHSKTGTSLSPRVAALWQMGERESLRASFGTGFRNASLRELWFQMPVTVPTPSGPATFLIAGNEDLDPERMRSFELGYRYHVPETAAEGPDAGATGPAEDAGKVNLGATVFYNLVDDLIEFTVAPNTTTAVPTNQVDQAIYGVEVDADYLFVEDLVGFGNFSYGIRRLRDGNDRLESVPRYKANLGLRYTFRDKTGAMLWLHYFDDTRIKAVVPGQGVLVEDVPDYLLLNASIGRAVEVGDLSGTLYLQAFNLLDRDHREHAGSQSYGQVVMVGFSLGW